MASGGETTVPCCSPCKENDRNTRSRHYCIQCEMYYCSRCVEFHSFVSGFKDHQINDVYSTDQPSVDESVQSEEVKPVSTEILRCTVHQDTPVDTYCRDHDAVCCIVCVVVKHRSCSTTSIATASKDYASSPEIKKYKAELADDLAKGKAEKEKRTDNLDSIGKQKLELLEEVDTREERIIARVKELAEVSRQEIRSKHEEQKTGLDKEIGTLDVVLTTLTDHVNDIEQAGDEDLFALVKTKQTFVNDGRTLLADMNREWIKRELTFNFHDTLENQLLSMKSLCSFDENGADKEDEEEEIHLLCKEYEATFERNINIKRSNDGNEGRSYDMCLTDSGDLLLTDYDNKKLKRYNSDLKFKDELKFGQDLPFAVSKLGKRDVAVRTDETNVVHIVSVGQSLQITSSFTLADGGYGMVYDECTGEIFACEEGNIGVYSKTGQILRTIEEDENGDQIFQACRQIALSDDMNDLFVTDQIQGLIVLDKNGTLKMKIAVEGVSRAWPLCVLPVHIVLVGDSSSGKIFQIDRKGKQIGSIIDSDDGRDRTYCAVYDRERKRLIVGGGVYPCIISVYNISEIHT